MAVALWAANGGDSAQAGRQHDLCRESLLCTTTPPTSTSANARSRNADAWHPTLFQSHAPYYGGVSWANEVAKRGYAVLVPDAFTFGSRRVRLKDVSEHLRQGTVDTDLDDEPDNGEAIEAYNQWAAEHESVMAKSLFSAGTTWPGVFLGEDQRALEVLARPRSRRYESAVPASPAAGCAQSTWAAWIRASAARSAPG